jgi:hypothetical protein
VGGEFIIPIAEPKFTKNAVDDPLLQVPPASRGNRTPARFPSRSGGNLKEGGNCELWLCSWYYYYALPRRRAQSQKMPATIKPHEYSRKTPIQRKAPIVEPKLGNHNDIRLNHAPNNHTGTSISKCKPRGGQKSKGTDNPPAANASDAVHQKAGSPLNPRACVKCITSATLRNHASHATYHHALILCVPEKFPDAKSLTP